MCVCVRAHVCYWVTFEKLFSIAFDKGRNYREHKE